MAGQVKLVVTAEMAQAFSAFSKLVEHQGKAERGMEKLAAAGSRAERAQAAAAQKLVGRVQAQTRGAELAVSQSDRVALKAGFDPGGGALGTSIARRAAATDIRLGRARSGFDSARLSYVYSRSLSERMDREARMAREAVANERAMFSGNAAALGGFGRAPGETSIDASARKYVAGRVAGSGELAGKVSPQDMDNMVARRAAQLRRRQEVRQNVAGGALAVGAAVAGVMNAADEQLTGYADALVQAEDQLAGLYGVGGNAGNRAQVRADAISTSVGRGVSLGQVGELRGRMESAFEDLPGDAKREAERAALGFGKLGVQDTTSTALGLGAAYQTFGAKLGGGGGAMRTLANRLAHASDVGAFDPDRMTPYLSMIYNAFDAGGYRDVDANAAMAVASKTGMREESFSTGVRNLSLLMMEGESKGKFKRTGNIANDAKQLAAMESPELLDAFGRDTFVVAKMLADNNDLLARYVEEQSKITGSMDLIGQKVGRSYADPTFGTVETIKSARAAQAAAPLLHMQDPAMAAAVSEWEIYKTGADLTTSPMMSWFKKPAIWLEAAMDKMDGGTSYKGNSQFNVGLQKIVADARSSGDEAKASGLELRYGARTNTYYTNGEGAKVFTGEQEAQDLVRLRNQGYDLTAGEYTQYMSMRFNNSEGADKYLASQLVEAAKMNMQAARTMAAGARDTNAHAE